MCESCGDKFQRRQGSLKSRTGDGDEYKSKLVNSAAAAATASVHGMPVDSAASRIVGGSKEALAPFANKDSCPGCKKQAFPFDKIPGPLSTWWHKKCLSCNKCKKQLDSMAKMRAETPFCSNCY